MSDTFQKKKAETTKFGHLIVHYVSPSDTDCLTGGESRKVLDKGSCKWVQFHVSEAREKAHPEDACFLNQEMTLEVGMITGGKMSINRNIS